MKSAREWTDWFCNIYVIPTKANVIEDFIKHVQEDARAELLNTIQDNRRDKLIAEINSWTTGDEK